MPDPDVVALFDIVTVVEFVTLWIVVPGGIPVPAIAVPTSAAVKLADFDVRVAELLVITASVTVVTVLAP